MDLARSMAPSIKQMEARKRLCLQKEVGDMKIDTPAPGAGLR